MFRNTTKISLGLAFVCFSSLQAQDVPVKMGQDKMSQDKMGQDKMSKDKMGAGKMGMNLSDMDRQFIEKASTGGMHEVEMGKLGVQKASNAAVKKYAQRIVADHTKANKELMALAKRKSVMLEGGHGTAMMSGSDSAHSSGKMSSDKMHSGKMDSQMAEHASKLNSMSGTEFDKAFVQAMIEDHNKDISLFESAASSGTDSEVKAWATKTLPTLKAHLKEAQALPMQ